jgi:hypothetical protein
MDQEADILMQKVRFIMESPSERLKYKNLAAWQDKLHFLKTHFIMSDMAVRLLERQYLLSPDRRDELMSKVDQIIEKIEM